jgi:outer membrane protein TolC
MKCTMKLLLICAAGIPATIAAQTYTHDEYIAAIRPRLPEVRSSALSVKSAETDIRSAQAVGDTTLGGNAYYKRNTAAGTQQPVAGYSSELGLTKRITSTGTTVSGGMGYALNDYDTAAGSSRTHSPYYFAAVRQSLLKNSFGVIDRLAASDAEWQKKITQTRAELDDASIIRNYSTLYFQLLSAQRKKKLAEESLAESERVLARTRERFRTGSSANDEYQNARRDVLARTETVESLDTAVQTYAYQAALPLGMKELAAPDDEFDTMLRTAEQCAFEYRSFGDTRTGRLYALSIHRFRDAGNARKNALRPELDLVGRYQQGGADDTLSRSMETMNQKEYYLGIELSMALGNSAAGAEDAKNALQTETAQLAYESAERSHRESLDAIARQASLSQRVIAIKKEKIESLRSEYATELARFSTGSLALSKLTETAQLLIAERLSLADELRARIELFLEYQDAVR